MSRKLIAIIVASTLVLGSIGVSAQPIAASQGQAHVTTPISAIPINQPPLQPAGAAGIREAQGFADVDVWFISGLILAAIIWAGVGDDDEPDSTEST